MKRLFLLIGLIGFHFLINAPYINYYFIPSSKTPSTTYKGIPGNPIKISTYDPRSITLATITYQSGQGSAYERVHKNGTPYYAPPVTCAQDANGQVLGQHIPISVHTSGIGIVMKNACSL